MLFNEFRRSLDGAGPPDGAPLLLTALWWDGKGDWARAHEVAQTVESVDGAWVHAYLHRKEGEAWNADYWYKQAGRPPSPLSLDAEWEEIVKELLARS
jgi:hypothetical protein